MIKYNPSGQLTLQEFQHPIHQQLKEDNRWALLAELVPSDELAGIYAKRLNAKAGIADQYITEPNDLKLMNRAREEYLSLVSRELNLDNDKNIILIDAGQKVSATNA
ncbi:MAG TPA: hypothetical protein ENO05_10320 [Bacteroides sp.]|nr:hypothetical protein [Bacteroides sp.]